MKFTWPTGFEIPDALWIEAGMLRFRPRGAFYPCTQKSVGSETALTISVIEPPMRNPGIPVFNEHRLRDIFRAFASDLLLPPIEVFRDHGRQSRYRVRDGFHRFYASAAVGYPCIPVTIVEPPFEFEASAISPSGG